jgi:hypothetical protein
MNKPISIPFALAMAVLLGACPAVDSASQSEEWSDLDPAWVDGEFMVPTVCFFDELNGSGIAESGFNFDEETETEVSFTVANGELTMVDGATCIRDAEQKYAPEYPGCEQTFDCGTCLWKVTLSMKTMPWRMKAWPPDYDAGWGDCIRFKYVDYTLGDYNAGSGGPGPDPGPGTNTCPSSCQVGLVCCKPPFCAGDCVGSPCC